MKEYIYESSKNRELSGSEAIIMLPDIYCQTDYSKETTEKFASEFGRPVFMLDYFYLLTNQANIFSENDREKVHGLMQNFKGEEFASFFQTVLAEIKETYPSIKTFSIIGFCFGGRLAYIAGGEKEVSKIISFYGAGPHTPNYISGQNPIEYLAAKRKGDTMGVTSFFGTNDASIPESDRQKVKDMLTSSGISYESYEYPAGHAYFQEGRKNYDGLASRASWEVLEEIFT